MKNENYETGYTFITPQHFIEIRRRAFKYGIFTVAWDLYIKCCAGANNLDTLIR